MTDLFEAMTSEMEHTSPEELWLLKSRLVRGILAHLAQERQSAQSCTGSMCPPAQLQLGSRASLGERHLLYPLFCIFAKLILPYYSTILLLLYYSDYTAL